MSLSRIAIAPLGAALLLLTGCPDRICGGDGQNANVQGDWLISGQAECAGDPDGVQSTIRLSAFETLSVRQELEGERLELDETVPVQGGQFDFIGSVQGGCVDFSIQEIGPDYEISYDFSGVVDGNEINGSVTGVGTGLCKFEGSFDVTIFTDPSDIPDVPPRPDAGFIDAGEPDSGLVDAGTSSTSTTGSSTTSTRTPSPRRECFTDRDCAEGVCVDEMCVPECDFSSECAVGEFCSNRRCEDSDACNCQELDSQRNDFPSWALFFLFGLAAALLRRIRPFS